MDDMTTTLTERGQTSVPAAIRKQAGLAPGQALRWEFVSEHELRVFIPEDAKTPPNAVAMIEPLARDPLVDSPLGLRAERSDWIPNQTR